MKWYTLAFMAFSTVWGFGNVLNGFVYFNGIQVIFSWVLMFALYFVPYALMVGELGSAFKNAGGGVSSWIKETMGPKLAYYAGFTYWACHITYIASKGTGGLKALSWVIFRNHTVYDTLPTIYVQLATLAVFLLFCYIASRGLNPLKKLATLAGTSMFVMSILYILMMFAAPAINPNGGYVHMDFSFKNIVPQFNVQYFTSLSILVFAVGGCEKISPYVNKVENPEKGFPKGMIALAIMVCVCAILGTFAMGMMFDPKMINASEQAFESYVANGAYWSFQKLGEYYHMGDTLLVIYALCNMVGQFSTLVLIQSFVPGAAAVLKQLNKLNSVCMPMRYLWVFAAYVALRQAMDKFPADYRFVKNQAVAKFFGIWCFIVTAACCVLGMYDKDPFTFALNVIAPVVLCALGLIMPKLAEKERREGRR